MKQIQPRLQGDSTGELRKTTIGRSPGAAGRKINIDFRNDYLERIRVDTLSLYNYFCLSSLLKTKQLGVAKE